MIRGIGIDSVSIPDMEKRLERMSQGAMRRMFTVAEIEGAKRRGKRVAEYLATRFAAKEAVYKAIAHSAGCSIDLRRIETLNHDDGCPYVNVDEYLDPILRIAGVNRLHITITTEGEYATAFVVAEGEEVPTR